MLNLDHTDLRLIRLLEDNARLTNVQLAEALNLSPTPCLRRVKKLERLGVIKGYEARVDRQLLGFAVSAYAFVTLTRNSADIAESFERQVSRLSAVAECSVITGAYDYVLRIIAKSLEDYETILKTQLGVIEPIANIESTIILKQVDCLGRPDY